MRYILVSGGKYYRWDYTASGGSEGYSIDLGERLASLGHEVWQYVPTPWQTSEVREHNGVKWADIEHMDGSMAGVWIFQRDPNLVHKLSNSPNQFITFAAHDFDYTDQNGIVYGKKAWVRNFDRIYTESESHTNYFKEKYPEHKDKIQFVGAYPCLDKLKEFPKVDRNPYRLTFSSNPTRGLITLLKIFKRAHEEVPDLELHVFYGWEAIDLAISKGINADNLTYHKQQVEKWMDHPKVFNHGRLPSVTDVWVEYAKSGLWCYPLGDFIEINCQTAQEAQLFGAIPIANARFALSDHVRHGVRIEGNPDTQELVRCRYVRALVDLASNPEVQEKIRGPMMDEAKQLYNFSKVVGFFDELGKSWEPRMVASV